MLKFTIRELFLLTAIVALASGWWTNRNNLKRQTAEAALWE